MAVLLSQNHKVYAVDVVPEKVELINNRKSPIKDEYIEKYLAEKELDLTATLDAELAYKDADFVIIAAPTNYDSKKNYFDTSAVESVIDLVGGLNGYDFVTYVPDVIGLKRMSAVDAVHDNSLNVRALRYDESVKDYDDSLNAMVWRQSPGPSDSISVNMGSEVTLYLTLDEHKIPAKEELL